MLHLLSIEYSKVKNYATFWVMLIIYAILVPLSLYGISAIELTAPGSDISIFSGTSLLKFPAIWNFVTYMASWFNLLLGILVVLIVCNDFNYRTFKQNVIDGLSKQQVIASKFIFLIALAIAVTVYTVLLGLLFGSIYSDGGSIFGDFYYVGIYFIQTIGYFTIAFLFAILLKKPALSIILFAVAFIFKFVFYLALGETISQYFPINLISDLTPFPLQWLTAMVQMNPDADAQSQAMDSIGLIQSQSIRTVVAMGYIGILVFISNMILKKRDL